MTQNYINILLNFLVAFQSWWAKTNCSYAVLTL